ncbi:tRNA pseudouridine13 synthase [Trypanosoma rangeli]|uniref:tRNA pseudouridine13 synthase n=1 Tax=Trypanosoma rangeli TaxID=5698 RepID=A0A422N563_TRYRA|nr:tRNA pseudouridine13 synthase [Trypanosoma rangeli]RNF00604.1 tRNA pseudouridine13 synthase [Trypanosoma rangeli]|eukprot:RNF00604.1 tRNA pseudouridine13 synthase [Trypanosoma rangeli]
MKLASKGPILRWSLRNPTTGAIFSRSDWRSGRDLGREERDSGLLLRLRDIGSHVSDGALPVAVVKAQPSDFQVNEIDASGSVATLEKAPKGKWRKISRPKTLLIEDDAATPFGDPAKTFTPRVQSYGEYVRVLGKLPQDSPILRFVVYRDAYSLLSVENRMRYALSLQPGSALLCESSGGSFGCISQYGICIGITREFLPHASRHYNLHPLIFNPQAYHAADNLEFLLRRPSGYYYRLVLRCVEGDPDTINHHLKRLSERGFINYFGVETFGVGSNRLFELAAFAAQGDFRQAVGGLLQCVAECDGLHHDYYIKYLNADPSTVQGMSKLWADAAKHMRSQKWVVDLLRGVVKYHESGEAGEHLSAIWDSLPIRDRVQASAAEFVWNAMASQRLLSRGLNVVEGDVVRLRLSDSSIAMGSSSASAQYKLVTAEDIKRGVYNITDVVLPVPYGTDVLSNCVFPQIAPLDCQLYKEFAARHGLSFLFEKPLGPSTFPRELYRSLVERPRHLQASVINDPNSFTCLKSDLLIMQEQKRIHAKDMDYVSRVREPCVYNVSERFVEKIEPIKKFHTGRNSVVVFCRLPGGTSPFVMLREAFSLRYAAFQDMYGVL